VVETLESIKDQIYENIELIISDDCSGDDTVSVCKEWLYINNSWFADTKIIEADKNSGIPANCNRGLHATSGEWIKFIAGDDALEQDSIKDYIEFAGTHRNIEVIFRTWKRMTIRLPLKECCNSRETKIKSSIERVYC
jgi:alpha-1,3-rhamnosyltransferase